MLQFLRAWWRGLWGVPIVRGVPPRRPKTASGYLRTRRVAKRRQAPTRYIGCSVEIERSSAE